MRPITKAVATAALSAVKQQFASWITPGYGPKLVKEWTESGHWAIVWEEGAPYDWTVVAVHGGNDLESGVKIPAALHFPNEVFAEPVNGCVLGLYPHHSNEY